MNPTLYPTRISFIPSRSTLHLFYILGYPRPIGEGSKGQWVDCNWTSFKIIRQPFWKRHCWKSLGFCLQPQRTCTWNLKLKFQSKLELCCLNHVTYRVQKPKKSNMATRQPFRKWSNWKSIGSYSYTQVLSHWSFEFIFKAKLKLESGNTKIQHGCQAAILKLTPLKINRLLSYGLCTNGHWSAALGWLPFILLPVFVQAAVIRSW